MVGGAIFQLKDSKFGKTSGKSVLKEVIMGGNQYVGCCDSLTARNHSSLAHYRHRHRHRHLR